MAGLTLNDSTNPAAEVVKQADGNASVAVTLTAGAWGAYSVRPGTDAGWGINGPDGHGAAISGAADTPEDKTFTPDRPGRYLVVFEGYDGAQQVQLTALYEVRSATAQESIPAAGEGVLYDATTGWTRALEERLRQMSHLVRGGSVVVALATDGFTTFTQGDLCSLSQAVRPFAAGKVGQSLLDQPEAVALQANALFSTPTSTEFVAMVLEDIPINSVGLALIEGVIPFDTATAGFSSFSPLYADDFGALASTPGVTVRKVGYCFSSGGGNPESSPLGLIHFNGRPDHNTALTDVDYLVSERTLLAGMHTFAAGQAETVSMDYMRPSDVINPSLSPSSRVQLTSVVFRVSGYVTDASEGYYVELYDDSTQQLVSSNYLASETIQEYQGFLTLGTGTGEMPPDSSRPYSVRVRSNSGNLDETKAVVLTNVALVCIGGF